jgi:hypothetical protein
LKTGQYYLRSRPARDAIQFTLDVDALDEKKVVQNLTKAEMDQKRKEERLAKKRQATVTVENVDKDSGIIGDLNKKRKTS